MGLDISMMSDNFEQVFSNEDYDFYQHSLSRTFCYFIGRQNVVEHVPEFDQIGKITGVDITPIYLMEYYPDEEALEFHLENADSEAEKQEILDRAEEDRTKLSGNIDIILDTLNKLIEKLTAIDHLSALLLPTNMDTLGNEKYFADFPIDKGQGYIGNNFGQDLRNFRRFVTYAKEKGATTVWFSYG